MRQPDPNRTPESVFPHDDAYIRDVPPDRFLRQVEEVVRVHPVHAMVAFISGAVFALGAATGAAWWWGVVP